jgi:hypothetical protein
MTGRRRYQSVRAAMHGRSSPTHLQRQRWRRRRRHSQMPFRRRRRCWRLQPHTESAAFSSASLGPSVKGEKAIPEKSPAERPGGGACLPPFPPPSEAPALAPPASDGSLAASPPAAHRPDQGQCDLCGPTALRTRPTTPTRTSEAGRRRDYRQLRSYKKDIPEKSPAERRAGSACLPPFPPSSEAAPAPPPPPAAHRPDQS